MSSSSLNNPSANQAASRPSPLGELKGTSLLPQEFEAYTRPLFGEERWKRYLASFSEETPVSVRYNPLKQQLLSEGDDNLPVTSPVSWCRNAFYLSERPDFTLDPLFHAGLYYVQEASSMFLDEVMRQLSSLLPPPTSVLDLCAAPGGKSTLLRAAMPAEATLYSNEVNRKRANILYENIRKQGYPNVIVTSCSSADYGASGQDFDIILTDVPCSGEGMFRKDPDTISEWSLQNVMKCSKLQREIVADVWPRLKPGGLLIYSTCTFNLHENEENILWILRTLGGELLPVETKPEWNITSSLLPELQGPVYRFIPGITRGEGLFMAVIRKAGSDNDSVNENDNRNEIRNARLRKSSFLLSRAVMHPDILYPSPSVQGTKDKASVEAPTVPLTRTQALQYLHREALILPPDTPKGIVIVTYRNLPLGYAKNIGSRANNLYPQEWRIRKQI
ncbi:MAG: hypothetical protein IIZ88_03360 [Prevotella sp.]|nr:hypothetical protein [Prevotella sp.]